MEDYENNKRAGKGIVDLMQKTGDNNKDNQITNLDKNILKNFISTGERIMF